MSNYNKQNLYDDLLKQFMVYQHRLDCPMPTEMETPETIRMKYVSDPIFHAKVQSLVCAIMRIVDKHVNEQ